MARSAAEVLAATRTTAEDHAQQDRVRRLSCLATPQSAGSGQINPMAGWAASA